MWIFFFILIGWWICLQKAINKERKDPRQDKITIVETTTWVGDQNIDVEITHKGSKFIR